MYEEEHDRALYETAFSHAMTFAAEGLKAERAMIAYSGNGRLLNLEADHLWTREPISLTLLRSLIEEGQPRYLVDLLAREEFTHTSITLSGIISIIYVPIRSRTQEICGFYYLDNRVRSGAFQEKDLKQAEAVVTGRLEPLLRETACRPLSWELLLKTCWF